jgi:hypothetical protein
MTDASPKTLSEARRRFVDRVLAEMRERDESRRAVKRIALRAIIVSKR